MNVIEQIEEALDDIRTAQALVHSLLEQEPSSSFLREKLDHIEDRLVDARIKLGD